MTDNFPEPKMNTDHEIWRLDPDNYYSPSVFVTKKGEIGICVNGIATAQPIEMWLCDTMRMQKIYKLPRGIKKIVFKIFRWV